MGLISGNFTRVNFSGWINGQSVSEPQYEGIEQRAAQCINGDDGSVHAPATVIVIDSSSGGILNVGAPTLVSNGGRLKTLAGARVTLDLGDWERLSATHKGRTRVLATPLIKGVASPPLGARPHFQLGGLVAVANMIETWTTQGPFSYQSDPEPVVTSHVLEVATGGILSSVEITYRAVLGSPSARLLRVAPDGTPTSLCSAAVGADADGWVPSAAIDATQTVQSWTFLVDGGASPANAVVDRGAFTYVLQIREDQSQAGTGTGFLTQGAAKFPYGIAVAPAVKVASTAELDVDSPPNPVVLDGYTVALGDYVLLKDQGNTNDNGLYVAPAPGNPWRNAFRTDFSIAGLPQGYVVPVLGSGSINVNASTYWQYQGPDRSGTSYAVPGTYPNTWGTLTDDPIGQAIGTFAPQGNVYHMAFVTLKDIADLRWQ